MILSVFPVESEYATNIFLIPYKIALNGAKHLLFVFYIVFNKFCGIYSQSVPCNDDTYFL